MIEHHWHRNHSVLEVVPRAPLQREDFEALAQQVDPVIEEHGSLAGVLINAASFPGWEDFSGLVSHFTFVRDHHRNVHKIAVVSDQPLLGYMPRLVDHFVSADVRPFPGEERRRALEWLAEPG
ncbi:STAS/SEC14 domain-containing protein [Microbulbifer sp. YPW16]|uniref:STAS/SEC14 domain-containing protein n=1 Tax=Microbulbifer sp. YPW16 TaxID=2904242 RepID=UPI001E4B9189|nr:STAS/SEC14 domain-containing protein [Microbulbifer sp. YPW16]UHQ55539.1 STAS/SEC14 domain-containing protein [Microbulbifer sp. YPW16]